MSWPFVFLTGTNLVLPDNCAVVVPRKYVVGKGDKVFIGSGSVLRII